MQQVGHSTSRGACEVAIDCSATAWTAHLLEQGGSTVLRTPPATPDLWRCSSPRVHHACSVGLSSRGAHTGSPQIAARTEGRSQRKRARPAYLEAYDEGQVPDLGEPSLAPLLQPHSSALCACRTVHFKLPSRLCTGVESNIISNPCAARLASLRDACLQA